MLDGKKYLELLTDAKLLVQTCPRCGSDTHFISGGDFFCNLCEQRNDPTNQEPVNETARTSFAAVLTPMGKGDLDGALKSAEQMLKNNLDPTQLYLLGVFYRYLSDTRYYQKDYNIKGFMEANADNTRTSLDLTARWKECFYKATRIVDSEINKNLQVDADLILMKFLAEIRLRRFVDAANSLRRLQNMDKHGLIADYALLVYSVEKPTKQAEASVAKSIARNNLNAYYYLAKHLAREKKLQEAADLLDKLNRITEIPLVEDLLNRVRSTQEASKV